MMTIVKMKSSGLQCSFNPLGQHVDAGGTLFPCMDNHSAAAMCDTRQAFSF
eukprot:m.70386 g.70386  ORF g.70386 m.70386 type:complete len:51 (-) comp12258_c0_seq5:310-462(-)